MRLVCPNCSAQYEIDASVIPDEGRDVQCSNCGHTWFELPPAGSAEKAFGALEPSGLTEPEYEPEDDDIHSAVEEALSREEPSEDSVFDDMGTPGSTSDFDTGDAIVAPDTDNEEKKEKDETPEIRPRSRPRLVHENEVSRAMNAAIAAARQIEEEESGVEREPTQPIAPKAPEPDEAATPHKRRPADAAALDILREEAERELSQRRAPPSEAIETQTDMGIERFQERKTPSRALRARMAHLGEDVPDEADDDETRIIDPARNYIDDGEDDYDDGYEEPQRDLLPGIDEINSTLKPDRGAYGRGRSAARGRAGFRIGLLLVVFLVLGLIFTYAQAPAIARALPQTEAPLITYVERANVLRDWINAFFE